VGNCLKMTFWLQCLLWEINGLISWFRSLLFYIYIYIYIYIWPPTCNVSTYTIFGFYNGDDVKEIYIQ
jgi:hypothetical protein